MPQPRRRRGARLITSCATVTLTFVALLAFYQLERSPVEEQQKPIHIEKHQLRPPARVARHVDRQVPPKAQKHFYSQPSSSHTAAALTKRGWRQTKHPEAAEDAAGSFRSSVFFIVFIVYRASADEAQL